MIRNLHILFVTKCTTYLELFLYGIKEQTKNGTCLAVTMRILSLRSPNLSSDVGLKILNFFGDFPIRVAVLFLFLITTGSKLSELLPCWFFSASLHNEVCCGSFFKIFEMIFLSESLTLDLKVYNIRIIRCIVESKKCEL